MNNITKNFKTLSITSLLICFTGISQPGYADIGLPDSPLFLGTSVQPNIFLSMDDSSSMDREVLITPEANAVHGNPDRNSRLDFTPNNDQKRRELCYKYNVTAYNPGVTYEPWVGEDEDDNDYADVTSGYTAVLDNPYDSTGGSTEDVTGHVYYEWTDGDTDGDGTVDGAADGAMIMMNALE